MPTVIRKKMVAISANAMTPAIHQEKLFSVDQKSVVLSRRNQTEHLELVVVLDQIKITKMNRHQTKANAKNQKLWVIVEQHCHDFTITQHRKCANHSPMAVAVATAIIFSRKLHAKKLAKPK